MARVDVPDPDLRENDVFTDMRRGNRGDVGLAFVGCRASRDNNTRKQTSYQEAAFHQNYSLKCRTS
jgi:hypothetical protein